MAAKSKGTPIGVEDDVCVPICVGDEIRDVNGNSYTIDQHGHAKPLSGGNAVRLAALDGVMVTRPFKKEQQQISAKPALTPKPEKSEEEKELELISTYIHAAGDQRLVDELRSRGWTVACTKIVEKVVFEEVAL